MPLALKRTMAVMAVICLASATNAEDRSSAVAQHATGGPGIPDGRGPPFLLPTPCAGDISPDTSAGDPDVSIRDDATLNVMFHGNRFVAAPELVAEFERLNAGERVNWTALPPSNTRRVIAHGPESFAGSRPFFPDVVMMPAFVPVDGRSGRWVNRGLYSNLHGIVLIARAGDPNVTGTDVKAIVNNPQVKVVLAGQQALAFPLIAASGLRFDDWSSSGVPDDPRFGVSQQRHHRSVPARILAGCEDVGFEYLQSLPYLEQQFPGRFGFVAVAMSAEDRASEASYLYVHSAGPHVASGEKFATFMKSKEALTVLSKYHLEP